MNSFKTWLDIQEGWGKNLALAGALAAGTLGNLSAKADAPDVHRPAASAQSQETVDINLGGMRQTTASLTFYQNGGMGKIKFLTNQLDDRLNPIPIWAKRAIKAVTRSNDEVKGFKVLSEKYQGKWTIAQFSWISPL